MSGFKTAFDRLIGHEGGFSNNPKDPGNWTGGRVGRGELKGTKCGIAANTYGHLDIENLTMPEIEQIYREDFWDILGERTHDAIKYQLFDAAVNHGHGNAIRMVQRSVGAAPDGIWGPVSQGRLDRMDLNDVLLRFLAERLEFMTDLRTFDDFGRGWSRRIANNLRLAAQDN